MKSLGRSRKPRHGRKKKGRQKLARFAGGIRMGGTGFGGQRPLSTAGPANDRGGKSNGVTFSRAAWPKPTGAVPTTKVLDLALSAASCAINAGMVESPKTLTVTDYSRPSTTRRLWVIDLKTGETLRHELVAHGQG